MRVGLSPNIHLSSDYRPARVTVCVLTFVPEQVGYFAHRFDVVKLCLHSIVKHTDGPYDLMVFDNGSCSDTVDYLRWLRDQGIIDYLILSSKNVGVHEALKMMVRAAPGEVIAYSNDDVLFYPNWLKPQLEILDTFPRVGMVSGVAVRKQFRYGNRYLQTYLSDFPEISVTYGHFIPDDWEIEFFLSTGGEPDKSLEKTRREYRDIVLEHKGVKAYSTAVHWQYVAPKAVIVQALSAEWEARLMRGPDIETDQRIDSFGYARLSTFQRYVQHIGNVITPDLERRISTLSLPREFKAWRPPTPFVARLVRQRIVRGVLTRLENWSHFLLTHPFG